jgi:tripartite-type tricarboxylate transporter receptor subunit TctC
MIPSCAIGGLVGLVVGLGLSSVAVPSAAKAETVADFYRGKTVNLVSGFTPNGEYDSEFRLIGRHIRKHIPGQPQIVSSSMPGAGSLVLANHLFKVAPADGTYVGMFALQVAVEPFLQSKAALFDPLKFKWIGTLARNHQYCAIVPGAGVAGSVQEMLRQDAKETLFGSAGASSEIHRNTAVLKNVLGAKIRLVSGYLGMPAIKLAMQRGEINGVCGLTAAALRTQLSSDVASGRLKLILRMSGTPPPEFSKVPHVLELAGTAEQREMLDFFYGKMTLGRPIAVPSDVPAERVEALRQALAATIADKAFIDEAATLNVEITPTSGAEVAVHMETLSRLPAEFFLKVGAAVR